MPHLLPIRIPAIVVVACAAPVVSQPTLKLRSPGKTLLRQELHASTFVENMSAGRGWIAVVIVLVTNGRPIPLLGLVLLFGFVDSLSLRLQGFGFPQQFTEMMPYIASLIALIFVSIRRMRNLVGMRGYDNG